MQFQRRNHSRGEPEVNLIPLIDVVLVIIIFLMLTTTFSNISRLEINLPKGEENEQPEKAAQDIDIAITPAGAVIVNSTLVKSGEVADIAQAIGRAVTERHRNPAIIINADAKASHQSVIDVMQAARQAGLSRINFAVQVPAQ